MCQTYTCKENEPVPELTHCVPQQRSTSPRLINPAGPATGERLPVREQGMEEFEVYWAEVVAESMAQLAKETAQRATATALAYERSKTDERGNPAGKEESKSGGGRGGRRGKKEGGGDPPLSLPPPPLPGQPACDAGGEWLESKFSAAAAKSTARIAATMARRAAALNEALEPASEPAAATPLVLG